jgi:hypothetical protein
MALPLPWGSTAAGAPATGIPSLTPVLPAPAVAPGPAPTAAPAAAPGPAPAAAAGGADDNEGEPRLSLATEADRDAWLRSGLRFGVGFVYGRLAGLEGAPSGRLLGFLLRIGVRLDADWSVATSFQYAQASASGGLSGLRFAGTIDPTWHATRHLSLAFGLGFGGIVEGRTGRPDVNPLPGTLSTSYTFPSPGPPLPSCSGVGVAALARAEWSMILGPRSSTSLMLEAIGQWTGCVADTGTVNLDTGQAVVRRQWWPHAGVTLGWGFTWR